MRGPAPRRGPGSTMGRVIPESWHWRTRDETLAVWPGRHQELGADLGIRRRPTSRSGRPRRRRCGSACSTTTGAETRHQLTEHTLGVWHGQIPGVPRRPAVRLPRRRPVGPAPRAALQPAQAAARPVRPGDLRRARRRGPALLATTPATRTVRSNVDSAPSMPRSVVVHDEFDWGDDRRCDAAGATPSSTSCTSRASPSCTTRSPSTCAAPTPDSAPTPSPTTSWTSASPPSS